jgi:para-aminobenzoate synthetase component 1
LAAIQSIQRHIREGDVYEVNLAQCFATTCPQFKPTDYWLHLLQRQPVPFAALLRWGGVWALGASPERFLQLRGGQLVTQPIKGTAKRGPSPQADAELARQLALSEKERAENVMIVDLARNDLYRTCTPESVAVPGLFQVHTYPTLHQLVSTVTGTLAPHCTPSQALAAAFPPGSMTGAPKISAMQCIAQHEPYGRGLYAGSVGYVAPVAAGAGFDFNVVIRTLLYNTETHLLAYHVGGAITADSDPLAEYYETLTKAKALRQAFGFDLP